MMKRLSLIVLCIGFIFSCSNGKLESEVPILGDTKIGFFGNKTYEHVPGFHLIDQNGMTITEEQFKDKIQVVDFFFTNCPTICPVMTSHLRDVQEYFKNEKSIAIISYSIDVKNDTPEELRSYADRFDIDTKQWSLVTGTSNEIFDLAKGFKVSAFDDSYEDENTLIHDGTFVLLDQKRRVRGYYNGLSKQDTQRLILDIEKLLNEIK